MGNSAHRLRRKVHDAGHDRSGLADAELVQGNGSEDDADLLDACPKNLSNSLLILSCKLECDEVP